MNRVRLDRRVKLLVDALIDELDCSRSFLLHVGPRATRRAVSLLVRLGRAAEVCLGCLLHRGHGQKEGISMSFVRELYLSLEKILVGKLLVQFFAIIRSCTAQLGKSHI